MQSQLNIPRVTYTPKLATYMRKKGWRHIAIGHASACGCCVDLSEVATRFVDDAAADKLRAKGCVELHGELGSVLVARGMEYDSSVELGLRSFFGAKDITASGRGVCSTPLVGCGMERILPPATAHSEHLLTRNRLFTDADMRVEKGR